ncbi:hypothetical protein [Verminephrobacter eiseniae]|uniref:hypothetical protein n=1 Tax=Verminephrobacter eiseniae TaxID=364317 RepID=UPI00223738E7|nr:hypothetical protein [Verminephrobacter eiseniae]
MGIVAGIALTVLYQNATGLNAGQALPAEVAIAPGQTPAQAAIPAQYQQIIDTSPSLPVLPAPHAVALSIEDTKAAVQEKKVDDANGGGVHVVIRKRQVPQTVAPAIEANPAEKPAQATSQEPLDQATPSAGPVKLQAAPVEPVQAPQKSTPDLRIIQQQPDGLLVRIGNQVRFIEAGAKR